MTDVEPGDNDGDEEPSDIFARRTYQPTPRPPRKDFKPWHKPRKQYVRERLWGAEIDWVMGQREAWEPVRYIGLPGSDLIDLRYIHRRFCGPGSRGLMYLGFDESTQPKSPARGELTLSMQELASMGNVDTRSDVMPDSFRRLGETRSIAWDKARTLGPFDVLNVDLCKGIALDDPSLDTSMYDAIYQLCALQNRRSDPWSVLVTSRIGPSDFSASALERILQLVKKNVDTCEPFRVNLERELPAALSDSGSLVDASEKDFFESTTLGVCKWLLAMAGLMRCTFSISGVVAYRVRQQASYFDMVALAARYTPVPQLDMDPTGLATKGTALVDECEQAALLPRSVRSIVDVDYQLNSDDTLRTYFTDEMAELLRQARFDVDEYRATFATGA